MIIITITTTKQQTTTKTSNHLSCGSRTTDKKISKLGARKKRVKIRWAHRLPHKISLTWMSRILSALHLKVVAAVCCGCLQSCQRGGQKYRKEMRRTPSHKLCQTIPTEHVMMKQASKQHTPKEVDERRSSCEMKIIWWHISMMVQIRRIGWAWQKN